MLIQANNEWTTICKKKELTENSGSCVQFKNQQVAIFFCKRSDRLYAVDNFDPIAQANVISRGIMGSTEGKTYVASPLYKQRFDLVTGECFDSALHSLKTYAIRVMNEDIQLKEVS